MNYFALIGMLLAIMLIVMGSIKGYSVLILAPTAALLVALTSQLDIAQSILSPANSYLADLAKFVLDFFLIFALGSIMAKYMEKSGAIQCIADYALRFIDRNKPLHGFLAVYAITALLTYGGISLFVVMFAVVPLAHSLFKEFQIPWRLSPLPIILGLGTFTAAMLPGSPSIVNVLPTAYLQTTLTAAPIIGIVGTVVCIVVSILFMQFVIKRERHAIGTNHKEATSLETKTDGNVNKPSLLLSVLPIILLIVIILVGSTMKISNILVLALLAVIVVEMIMFQKFIPSQRAVLNAGVNDAMVPLLNAGATIAFGQMFARIKSFAPIAKGVLNVSSNKLIGLSILTMLFSIIMGSGSGAVGIISKVYALDVVALGYHPELVHRLTSMASIIFTNTPHCGVFLTLLSLAKLDHKGTFGYMYVGNVVSTLAALGSAFILSAFLY